MSGFRAVWPPPEEGQVRSAPLIAHVIHRLAIGGLENGLVNLVNNPSSGRYRHAIICLTDFTAFRTRIHRRDVDVRGLHKAEGFDVRVYREFWRVIRELKPAIVHTRNLSALEFQWVAAMAGVQGRIHGEHGWDTADLTGRNLRYVMLRKFCRAVVGRYIALSRDIESWLIETIGVAPERIAQIYNGVDARRFSPATTTASGRCAPFSADDIVFGTVGRLESVKNPLLLADAFVMLVNSAPQLRSKLRLAIVGDGSLRGALEERLEQAGLRGQAWIPGAMDDIPSALRAFDVFVLPSLNEGISNTILEAMASGLPVLATRVGGNPELVREGVTGGLVSPGDASALAAAMLQYARSEELRKSHGGAGRERVLAEFSLESMTAAYLNTYDAVLAGR